MRFTDHISKFDFFGLETLTGLTISKKRIFNNFCNGEVYYLTVI